MSLQDAAVGFERFSCPGNPAATTAFNRWSLVHLHKDNQAFQTVQTSTVADHSEFEMSLVTSAATQLNADTK